MIKRSWVRIPALDAGWRYLDIILLEICNVCLERPKINEIEAGDGPFKKQ